MGADLGRGMVVLPSTSGALTSDMTCVMLINPLGAASHDDPLTLSRA